MTAGVISLAEKKIQRQTTLRIDPELLRKARFYLDEENKSINEFVTDQLAAYVAQREAALGVKKRKREASG